MTGLKVGDCASTRLNDGRTVVGVICSVYDRDALAEPAVDRTARAGLRAVLQTPDGFAFNVPYSQLTETSLLELLVRA